MDVKQQYREREARERENFKNIEPNGNNKITRFQNYPIDDVMEDG